MWLASHLRPGRRGWDGRGLLGRAVGHAGGGGAAGWYRLNVVPIVLPALAERSEDLPLLIDHFLAAVATRLKREPKALRPEAYRALSANEWKGNVRELEHAIEQAIVLASDAEIGLEDLPASVRAAAASATAEAPVGAAAPASSTSASFKDAKQRVVERFERQVIGEALARHHGNVSKAAEELGMYRQHLQVKLAEYKIDPEPYRRRES